MDALTREHAREAGGTSLPPASLPDTIAEWVNEYLANQSWPIIRVNENKSPAEGPNWSRVRHRIEDAPLFANAAGVGVILGDAADGLVDIDLDHPLAVKLAPWFFPKPGLIFTRGDGSQSLHYLYRCPGAPYQKFQAPGTGTILEVRGNAKTGGLQTILPPSPHFESGEVRYWIKYGDLTEVTQEELDRAARLTAAAAVLVHAYGKPGQGRGNEFAMALSGLLIADGGWSEDDAVHLIDVAFKVIGDPDVENRISACRSTARAVAEGRQEITGVGKLAEFIGEPNVKCIKKWLSIKGRNAARGRKSKADAQKQILVDIIQKKVRLFHSPDRKAFATFPHNNHTENRPVRSGEFRDWLGSKIFSEHETVPTRQALDAALDWAEGQAKYRGEVRTPAVRVAEHDGAIFIDIGDDTWRTIRVTGDGWEMMDSDRCPVMFVRSNGTQALPIPQGGGSLDLLWKHLNVPDGPQRIVIVAWLIAALLPYGPYAGLIVNGEAGAGKTTFCRTLRRLVDPVQVLLASPPKEEKDLLVVAQANHVVGFDNLGSVPDWLSNGLCRLSTGGGFIGRELYSDDKLYCFSVMCPWIINGIDRLNEADDLNNRALLIKIPYVPLTSRKTEREFWAVFEADAPLILGALLDAVSTALRRIDSINPPELPRMADFAAWVIAAEPALPWSEGEFLKALEEVQRGAEAEVLAEDGLALAILELAKVTPDANGNPWRCTYGELIKTLEDLFLGLLIGTDVWPLNSKRLGKRLRRLVPVLRRRGVEITFGTTGRDHVSYVSIMRRTD